ncbi:MAG: cation:proton antiporter, partial [Lachnospiraceae bacterium]|nr:cation:proton antiporter [Lachnospiraceae bacterium]
MLITGFLMTRITKKLRLPDVTAYLVAGILIGPFCFNLIPSNVVGG